MGRIRRCLLAIIAVGVAAEALAQPAYVLHGLNFSPYMDGQSPGTPISESQIRARMAIIAPHVHWVRSFGTTGGLEKIGPVAREFGLNTAIGAWLGTNLTANETALASLINLIQAGHVDIAIVGSETLVRNDLSEDALINYINRVKAVAGTVPVTTADTHAEFLQHPRVVAACDLLFVNYYGYWESVPLSNAIPTLHCQHQDVQAAAGGKKVIVSETGWPSAGDSIGGAVPSPANAAQYFLDFTTWARAEQVEYFYFEAFDEAWKAASEGPQGAHWGVWDKNGLLKPGMDAVFAGNTSVVTWQDCIIDGPGTPVIEFILVPPIGSQRDLQGRIRHVKPPEWRVAVYIRVNGGWWTKPYSGSPLTTIRADGTWTCDITTGGQDQLATDVAAFLVASGYSPPVSLGDATLPPGLAANAAATAQVTRTPPAPGDFDLDGDVDPGDFAAFLACITGPSLPRTSGCTAADFDSDNDVDQRDFGVFQRCFSGANRQANASCRA
jgi:exo-beta-1,3-glucanase (GH17 family)